MLTHATEAWIRTNMRAAGRLGFALWTCLCLAGLAGCASAGSETASVTKLADRLCRLSPKVAPEEAATAAETAHTYPLELAREYRAVRPAFLHNVLINLGLRQRGLCFHWADDLSAKLQSLNLRTLQVRRGVAYLETRREHSSVVLTAVGQPFDKGIVLDAWRHSGRLYWGGVQKDRFPWIEVEVVASGGSPAGAQGGGVQ